MPGPARPNSWGPRPAALGYYLGTGTGFALESSDSSAEKDHDGPFGACPTWIFGYSQHDSMQVKSVRITSNLMAPSRALDAAHVLLYRGAVTKKVSLWLRWLIPSKLQVNTSNVGPEFMNRSNTIKYYSGSPVDFCISGQSAISTEAAGTSVFFWQELIGSVPPAVGTHHWNANWWQAVPKSQRLRWYSSL